MPSRASVTHVVGLGLAGLSAALRLAQAGRAVRLYEAAGHAGGRCRSFHDTRLGADIDNGNHLLLSGNTSALGFLDLIGARHELEIFDEAAFPFFDLATGERWTLRINRGPVPLWLLSRHCRVPGARLPEYADALRILAAGRDATVAEAVSGHGRLFERFWEPLTVAVLNMPPERGSARLIRAVLLATFARGGDMCRPMIARRGLGPTFVEPALARLAEGGIAPSLNTRLRALVHDGTTVTGLDFGTTSVELTEGDRVVLALPPSRLAAILPGIRVPDDDLVITNAHFRVGPELRQPAPPRFLGLVNATTQWIFTRGEILSITISAADAFGLDAVAADALLPRLWTEVRTALDLPAGALYQSARLVREKRATFDQSPAGVRLRPSLRTRFANLLLAGDATDTGLPATIEGAIRSGETAARAVLAGSPNGNFLAS